MNEPLLEARQVTKSFGGTPALRNVHLQIQPAEIHALCGENGAGKSTLIRVLSGYFPGHTFEGELLWNGTPIRLASVSHGESLGISVIHQELSLIDELPVAENLFLGRLPRRGLWWDRAETFGRARELLERFGVGVDPGTSTGLLGIAQKQLIEIARAMARNPRLLILDEPTAALSAGEIDRLLEKLRQLRSQGIACIYISHKLDEVEAIADRVTVLRDGESIVTCDAGELSRREIIERMVGREFKNLYPPRQSLSPGPTRLSVKGLSAHSKAQRSVRLHDINLNVRAGEILGVGGLMGAGRSELLMHLFGHWGGRTAGTVEVNGLLYEDPDPHESIRRGVMLVTEDRKRFGMIPGQTAHHNVSLSSLESISRWGWIDGIAEHRRGVEMLQRSQFRALSDQVPVERLSGGNQQKVVLARGLLCDPDLILLDEPTRGVDVAARREIYEQAQQLAAQGKAIVWVSSEIPELIGVCDAIVIMHEGCVVESFDASAGFDPTQLMAAAAGLSGQSDQSLIEEGPRN